MNLQLEGFEVETAVDGQDCLDKVTGIEPDVITLDVMMPRLDGWETAVQLRKSPQTAHIKVVLITARAQEDDKARGAQVGADAYLTKPFDPNEMIRVVRELAGRDLGDRRRAAARHPRPRPSRAGTATRCSARARQPGSYTSSLPLRLARRGPARRGRGPARRLAREPWIAAADLTGPGYLTVTVTHDALAGLAVRITRAGPACAHSDALGGRTMPGPPDTDLAAAPDWPSARAALAAHLTARLAAAAGATVILSRSAERSPCVEPTPPPSLPGIPGRRRLRGPSTRPVCAGHACRRAARAPARPGGVLARHVLGQSRLCCSVRACRRCRRAALGRRAGIRARRVPAAPARGTRELALLDTLSWLPERVAMAARRGRPDEFAGYLEELAARTIDTMSTTGFTTIPTISTERLWLADAARTGLAAGLALLGVGAPGLRP